MPAATLSLPISQSQWILRNLKIYLRETYYEMLRALRNKSYSLSVIGFPTMFYLLFGLGNRGQTFQGGKVLAKYLLGGYASFGVVGAALFGVGVGLAFDRTSGWLALKRASPMPALAYLVARCGMAILFGVAIVSLLCGLGVVAAGVQLSLGEFARLEFTAVLGAVPFAAMGVMLASVLPPASAPGIVNLLYLPMSYASGLWIPVSLLPHVVQHIAPWLPSYHLALLMLHAVGYGPAGDAVSSHVFALFGFTCIFLGIGALLFNRIEQA